MTTPKSPPLLQEAFHTIYDVGCVRFGAMRGPKAEVSGTLVCLMAMQTPPETAFRQPHMQSARPQHHQ